MLLYSDSVRASSVVLTDTTLTKGPEWTSPRGDKDILLASRNTENPASLWRVLTKNAQLEPNHKETLDEPKLRDYLRENGPVLFKNVKVMEGKD